VTQKRTVLVIDDEYGIADLLQFALEEENYLVHTAPNGKIGLATAQSERPDVILLDVMMPIMDGPTTLRAIQADATLKDIPVIMMSSIDEKSVRSMCDGLAGFMRKPFELDALIGLVGKAISS
jgi:DNA-binding response OmpR family regulator